MSSLNSLYLKKETLKMIVDALDKKGEDGIEITISINDENSDFGKEKGFVQNISAYVSQSKEQREAKKPKVYVGNGKTFWTDGKIVVPQKQEQKQSNTPPPNDDDNPFI